MENEALLAGLHLQQSSVEWKIRDLETSISHRSLNGIWWLLEYLPFEREDFAKSNQTTR
jgi:hypothetical protein